jgi:mannose-6-phosphate isomerase-like protein (cupin superfamily)
MSRRGQVFDNPVTDERAQVLTDPRDHAGRALVAHLTVAPGGGAAVAHRHPASRERFHVLRGRVGFAIDGAERTLGPGERAEVRPGVEHDWWQVGDEPAEVLVEVDPGDRFVEMVGTMFGLARDGKTDAKGLPRPLQLAVTARAYSDVMVVSKPPPWAQRLLFGVLAPLGGVRGLEPSYPQYLDDPESVAAVDPEAEALLDADGRLRWQAEGGDG